MIQVGIERCDETPGRTTSQCPRSKDHLRVRMALGSRSRACGLLFSLSLLCNSTVQSVECNAASPNITLGAYADSLGTTKRLDLHAQDSFEVYLVAVNATPDTLRINAWSARLSGAAANPQGGSQVTSVVLAGRSPSNVATYPSFEVGLGECVSLPPGTSRLLATLTFATTPEFDGGVVLARGKNSYGGGSLGMCEGEVRMVYRADLSIFVPDASTGDLTERRAMRTWFVGRGRVLEFVTPFVEHDTLNTLPPLPTSMVSISVSEYYLGNGPAEIAARSAGGIRVGKHHMSFVRGYGAITYYPLPNSEILFVASEALVRLWNYEPKTSDSHLFKLEKFYVLDRATPTSEWQAFTQEDIYHTPGVPIPPSLSENKRTAIPPDLLSQELAPVEMSVEELVSELTARYNRFR